MIDSQMAGVVNLFQLDGQILFTFDFIKQIGTLNIAQSSSCLMENSRNYSHSAEVVDLTA